MFFRNASGAISLAYVASGRLLGYVEEHMNAWDCLAGQLIIEEAGGGVEIQDANEMIKHGGRVVAGAPDVFADLVRIADKAVGTCA
jgi:myo-inositol-1(or 4)-monophosphatase